MIQFSLPVLFKREIMCSIQFLNKKKYLYMISSQNMQFTNCMSVCKNKLLTLQKWEKMQYESISVYQFILVLFRAWSIHRKFFKTYPALREYKGEFIEGSEAMQCE